MSYGQEYGQFSTDMTQVTIFDQARSTEALRSKTKTKKTSRGRTRSDVYKMIEDLQDKELLLHWQKLQVKTQLEQGLEFTLWRKWKPGDVGKLMDDVKLEDFDQVQEFIEYLQTNVYSDAQYMTLVLGRVDEILEQKLGIPASMKAMQLSERIVEDEDCTSEELEFRVLIRERHREWQAQQAQVLAGLTDEHSGLPESERFVAGELVTVSKLNDDRLSHSRIGDDDTQFEFIRFVQHNGRYAVWDNAARSSCMVETDCVDLIVAGETEMVIDPIAKKLDFAVIKAHHITGTELAWPAEVTAASHVALSQIRRFFINESALKLPEEKAQGKLHLGLAFLAEHSGFSRGSRLLHSLALTPLTWSSNVRELRDQIIERLKLSKVKR